MCICTDLICSRKLLSRCLTSWNTAQFVTDEAGSPNDNQFIISVTIRKGSTDNNNLREATATRNFRLRAAEVVS